MAGLNLSGMMGGGLVTENPTFQQSVLQNVQQGAGLARQSFGKAAGVDTRNHGERAKQELSKLDPNNPKDQAKIVELVGAINPEKAMELKAKYAEENKEKADKDKLGGALLKMARANGDKNAEAWILAGGDVKTIASQVLKKPELDKPTAITTMYLDGKPIKASVIGGKMHYASENGWTALNDDAKLSAQAPKDVAESKAESVSTMYLDGKPVRTSIIDGKLHYASEKGWTPLKDDADLTSQAPKDAKTKDTKTASLTKADRELYSSFFAEDESLQSAYQEEGTLWGTNDNDNKRLQIETRAKAIYTNNPELGQLGALRKAVAEAGGTLPPAQTTAQEKSSDPFGDA